MTLEIDVLTLFPAMIAGPLVAEHPRADPGAGLATIRVHDLREFGLGRHRSVDDTPYGGGAGMVMRVEPVVAAIDRVRRPDSTVILLDPGGEVFRQARAADLAAREHLVFVCPRYEGVDERIRALRRPRAVDRRLRPDRRRAAGARRHRRRHPAAARRHRRRVDRRGVVQRRPAGVPAVHPAAVVPGHGRAADPDVGRSRRRRALAPRASRSSGPATRRPDLLRTTADRAATDRAGARAILRRRSPVRRGPSRPPTRSFGCPPTQGTAA